jgi:hypothetical protein
VFKKFRCLLKLFGTIVQFKLTRPDTDYWSWLFSKVDDPKDGRYHDQCLMRFLFADAHARNDHAAVCAVYETFGSLLVDANLPEKYFAEFLHSFRLAGREDLENQILGMRQNTKGAASEKR